MIYNYMEEIVDVCLRDLLKNEEYQGICRCEQCMDDVKARALNKLPPFYVTGVKGTVFGKYSAMDTQTRMDVIRELTQAVKAISENRHCETVLPSKP